MAPSSNHQLFNPSIPFRVTFTAWFSHLTSFNFTSFVVASLFSMLPILNVANISHDTCTKSMR